MKQEGHDGPESHTWPQLIQSDHFYHSQVAMATRVLHGITFFSKFGSGPLGDSICQILNL